MIFFCMPGAPQNPLLEEGITTGDATDLEAAAALLVCTWWRSRAGGDCGALVESEARSPGSLEGSPQSRSSLRGEPLRSPLSSSPTASSSSSPKGLRSRSRWALAPEAVFNYVLPVLSLSDQKSLRTVCKDWHRAQCLSVVRCAVPPSSSSCDTLLQQPLPPPPPCSLTLHRLLSCRGHCALQERSAATSSGSCFPG